MRHRVPLIAATAAAAALAIAPAWGASGGSSDLKLHPNGFGPNSYAAWKAQQGEPDATGGANQALYFQKMTATTTNAAGVAVITGLEGQSTSVLSKLAFDYRTDGHCGAGAPRFNVNYTDPTTGSRQTFFVGCTMMQNKPAASAGWQGKEYDGPFPTGTINSLAIVFDEGNDVGQGFVYLDNITVNDTVWTSAADNGNPAG